MATLIAPLPECPYIYITNVTFFSILSGYMDVYTLLIIFFLARVNVLCWQTKLSHEED